MPSWDPRTWTFPSTARGWQEEPVCVEVDWTDAHAMRGWRNRTELEDEIAKGEWRCHTVGWLIYVDDECVIVCSQQAENGTYDEVMRIPRGMLTKVRRLQEFIPDPYPIAPLPPVRSRAEGR